MGTPYAYVRPPIGPRMGLSISELLMRQGDIAAQRAAQSGQIWGNAVQNISQLAADTYSKIQEKKQQEAQQAAFDQALSSWDPTKPQQAMFQLAKVVGPKTAIQTIQGLMAINESQRKAQEGAPFDPKTAAVKIHALRGVRDKLGDEYVAKNWQSIAPHYKDVFDALGVDLSPDWNPELSKGLTVLDDQMTAPQSEAYTLAPGAKRFGPSGQLIAENPAQSTQSKTPEQIFAEAKARAAGTAAGTPQSAGGMSAGEARDLARSDKSYQFISSQMQKVAQPFYDRARRLANLSTSLEKATPASDALVAPELLTVMAGGQGSGLRMNEAEISRIVGGRSYWEKLKAAWQGVALDPSKANSITPAQRAQMWQLVREVGTRIKKGTALVRKAEGDLIDATSVKDQRRILSSLKGDLLGLDLEGFNFEDEGGGDGSTGGTDEEPPG